MATIVPEQIRTAWANHNLIPVVGAGISLGAAGLPTWPGLLTKGVEYARRRSSDLHISPQDIEALVATAKANKLINGFGQLQDILGGAPDGVPYQAFLYDVFADPVVSDSSALDALNALRARVYVTTNYDRLLESRNVVKDGEVATWSEPSRIISILRGGRGIIHIHGRWDLPESVILSSADYQRISDATKTAAVAGALFHSGVLLFVGCSLDGVADPHLGAILKNFSELQGPISDDTTPHYMLVAGKPDGETNVRLRKLGIVPVSFGSDFSELPAFLRSIPQTAVCSIPTEDVVAQLRTLRSAEELEEIMQVAKDFLERRVFPEREIRIGFAAKCEHPDRTFLRNQYLIPTPSTHNEFSYPQTLAAWALIEGKILTYPADLDHVCDFGLLRRLCKFDRVRKALLATDGTADPVLSDFLSPDAIKDRTSNDKLTIQDIYQHWVGRQPTAHYKQFISVPVPIVETTTNRVEPPEYGVLNIDSNDDLPLLNPSTAPLLRAVSEYIALGFEHLQRKGN